MNSTILILSGISGSGKTTLAGELVKEGFSLLPIDLEAENVPSEFIHKIDAKAWDDPKIVVDGFRTYSIEEIHGIADILRSYSHTVIPLVLSCEADIANARNGDNEHRQSSFINYSDVDKKNFVLNASLTPLNIYEQAQQLILDTKSR